MTDTPQWNDDSMDARIRELAADHNRPVGEVPRDAMWQAIAPAWQAGRAAAAPTVIRRFRPAPFVWGAALAAGLVLGVMLERGPLAPRIPARVAAAPVVDHRQAVAPPAGAEDRTEPTLVPDATPPRAARRTASSSGPPATAPADVIPEQNPALDAPDARPLYRAAARQTFLQAEALLTAYRSTDDSHRDQESVRQAGRWARDVLSSTRLLLDSPAANDPQFRALFTDLELVLAQIVQLSGAPLQAGERDLIERGMRDRDLLPRLRSALPAGAATS
jgi:hypothetical protein